MCSDIDIHMYMQLIHTKHINSTYIIDTHVAYTQKTKPSLTETPNSSTPTPTPKPTRSIYTKNQVLSIGNPKLLNPNPNP